MPSLLAPGWAVGFGSPHAENTGSGQPNYVRLTATRTFTFPIYKQEVRLAYAWLGNGLTLFVLRPAAAVPPWLRMDAQRGAIIAGHSASSFARVLVPRVIQYKRVCAGLVSDHVWAGIVSE